MKLEHKYLDKLLLLGMSKKWDLSIFVEEDSCNKMRSMIETDLREG
jgi:hypothetical protein